MRIYKTESQRFVVERSKGTSALSVNELAQALLVMPNGYGVQSIENRSDGTTILVLQANTRTAVQIPKQ